MISIPIGCYKACLISICFKYIGRIAGEVTANYKL